MVRHKIRYAHHGSYSSKCSNNPMSIDDSSFSSRRRCESISTSKDHRKQFLLSKEKIESLTSKTRSGFRSTSKGSKKYSSILQQQKEEKRQEFLNKLPTIENYKNGTFYPIEYASKEERMQTLRLPAGKWSWNAQRLELASFSFVKGDKKRNLWASKLKGTIRNMKIKESIKKHFNQQLHLPKALDAKTKTNSSSISFN